MTPLTLMVFQFWGQVQPPPGVAAYNIAAGPSGLGLVIFVSNIIRLITIIAGVWSLLNLIFAGFQYITNSGNVKAVETAWQSIYMSLLGLIIIVTSFTIAAVIGFIFFNDVTFILNPKLTGIGVTP